MFPLNIKVHLPLYMTKTAKSGVSDPVPFVVERFQDLSVAARFETFFLSVHGKMVLLLFFTNSLVSLNF